MSWTSKWRPSPALIVAMAALVMAMSGAAIALPGKGSVKTNDIKDGAVTKKKIDRGAVGSQQIKGKSIKGNRLKEGAVKSKQLADNAVTNKKLDAQAVTADKVKDGSLTGKQVAAEGISSANIEDYAVIGDAAGNVVRATATNGANIDEAQAAAPEVPLFAKGQISLYGKCFADPGTDTAFGAIYVKTAADGAVFWNQGGGGLSGGDAAADFLNIATPEDDRVVLEIAVIGPQAELNVNGFDVVAANGTNLSGQVMVAAKNGALAGGNGVYGAGNVCLFGGEIAG